MLVVQHGGIRTGSLFKERLSFNIPVCFAGRLSTDMRSSIANIVRMIVILRIGTGWSVNRMIERILAYCSAMAQARQMLSRSIISEDEYSIIDTVIREKYGLSSNTLFCDINCPER